MVIPAQIKTDITPAYVSNEVQQFFTNYKMKHVTSCHIIPQYKQL